jgi:thiopeptide-type bacteriocin biosynthesis protein
LLGPGPADDHPLAPGLDILVHRSARLAAVAADLRRLETEGRLTVSLDELPPSFLHMHVNRLLRSAQREQEFVLYDFLVRHYESRLARRP